MKLIACLLLGFAAAAHDAHATPIALTDPGQVSAFQAGLTVERFESVSGRTPLALSAYTPGLTVPTSAMVFDEVAGVQFSVGGQVGVNRPALYTVPGGGNTVLGPVGFDFTTSFDSQGFMEVYFPNRVARVGFQLNADLGPVLVLALTDNFAFSGGSETLLEQADFGANVFGGFERATADIGGLKIFPRTARGFTIDDFSFGGTGGGGGGGGGGNTVPLPGTASLGLLGLLALGWTRRRQGPVLPCNPTRPGAGRSLCRPGASSINVQAAPWLTTSRTAACR